MPLIGIAYTNQDLWEYKVLGLYVSGNIWPLGIQDTRNVGIMEQRGLENRMYFWNYITPRGCNTEGMYAPCRTVGTSGSEIIGSLGIRGFGNIWFCDHRIHRKI